MSVMPCPGHCDHRVGVVRGNHGPYARGAGTDDNPAFQCCHCGRFNSFGRDLRADEIMFDAATAPAGTEG